MESECEKSMRELEEKAKEGCEVSKIVLHQIGEARDEFIRKFWEYPTLNKQECDIIFQGERRKKNSFFHRIFNKKDRRNKMHDNEQATITYIKENYDNQSGN